jgi:hypothetical protein
MEVSIVCATSCSNEDEKYLVTFLCYKIIDRILDRLDKNLSLKDLIDDLFASVELSGSYTASLSTYFYLKIKKILESLK